MTRDDIIAMARAAGFVVGDRETLAGPLPIVKHRGFDCNPELERFAELVAAAERRKHQTDIERWQSAAATAEKWRSLALAKDGDGRTVQRVQEESAAAEREACAQVCDAKAAQLEKSARDAGIDKEELTALRSSAWLVGMCADSIRARSKP